MRNLLFCLAVLLLSSCIPVGDFGAYWQKGTVDPALLGTWIPIASSAQGDDRKEARTVNAADRKRVQVASRNGTYLIDNRDDAERKKRNYFPVSARILAAGRYTFLMVIDREGIKKNDVVRGLIRYRLDGNVFRQYSLADGPAGTFLTEKYPGAGHIGIPPCKNKESKSCSVYVRITTLDDEVLKILAEIPDTREFWTEDGTFRRQAGQDK